MERQTPGGCVFSLSGNLGWDCGKVLDGAGSGSWSSVICGLDWAIGTHADADATNDIDVANRSLGDAETSVRDSVSTSDQLAICRATSSGIVVVAAAGNEGWDFDHPTVPDVPAAYPEVLTVTAMTDTDGRARALGATPACTSGEADDRAATFSNYAATSAGAQHTIAAPGTCIRSTLPDGYGVMTGTSNSLLLRLDGNLVDLVRRVTCPFVDPLDRVPVRAFRETEQHPVSGSADACLKFTPSSSGSRGPRCAPPAVDQA